MTKKNVKQVMLVLMLLVVGLYFVSGTYARYASTATGTATTAVATWAAKVNSNDMTTTEKFTLNFTEVPNENVVDGKIAPSSQLYTELVIDPTGSEVAMDYSIKLGDLVSDGASIENKVEISAIKIGTETYLYSELPEVNGERVLTGTIELESQSAPISEASKESVVIYVEWFDNGSEDPADANNVSDTELGGAAPTITMDVVATAVQHI